MGREQKRKKLPKHSQQTIANSDLCRVNEANKHFWFNMINLYQKIGNDDALQGIWCLLGEEEGILFKKKEANSQNQERAVNYIKQAHVHRSKEATSPRASPSWNKHLATRTSAKSSTTRSRWSWKIRGLRRR